MKFFMKIKKMPRNGSFALYKLLGNKKDKINFLMDGNEKSYKNKNINEEFSFNNSFKSSYFQRSKASGFGY